jgi:hypothetical protein
MIDFVILARHLREQKRQSKKPFPSVLPTNCFVVTVSGNAQNLVRISRVYAKWHSYASSVLNGLCILLASTKKIGKCAVPTMAIRRCGQMKSRNDKKRARRINSETSKKTKQDTRQNKQDRTRQTRQHSTQNKTTQDKTTKQDNTRQDNTTHHKTAQHNTTQHNTTQYNTHNIQHNTTFSF